MAHGWTDNSKDNRWLLVFRAFVISITQHGGWQSKPAVSSVSFDHDDVFAPQHRSWIKGLFVGLGAYSCLYSDVLKVLLTQPVLSVENFKGSPCHGTYELSFSVSTVVSTFNWSHYGAGCVCSD